MQAWEVMVVGLADRIRDELVDAGDEASAYGVLMEACSKAMAIFDERGRNELADTASPSEVMSTPLDINRD